MEYLYAEHNVTKARHFFARMRQPGSTKVHADCDGERCAVLQNNLKEYKTRHRTSECTCDELSIDAKRVDEILRDGALPLLHIVEGNALSDMSIETVPSQSNSVWVAVSHVWADGLGNPFDNALPRCQLQHLKRIIQDLISGSTSGDDSPESLLWIDTLCCPVGPEDAKRRALSEIKRTYEQATYVLVIDSTLQACTSETMDPIEIWASMMLSGWMRRLWTLQEGALPARDQRLWFQFRDKAASFRSLRQVLAKLGNSSFRLRGLTIDLMSGMTRFTAWSPQDPSSQSHDLATIEEALHFRSVSVRSDEPLLLGNLLNLVVSKILDGPENTRIHRMWSLMPSALRGNPKGIVFRLGPRLKEEGYCWAPATLMYFESTNPRLETRLGGDDEGKPTMRGLLVKLAGYALSMAARPNGLPSDPWNMLASQRNESFYMRDNEGSWYFVVRRKPNEKGDFLSSSRLEEFVRGNGDVWIAHAEIDFRLRPDGERQFSTAILVKLIEHKSDVMYVRSEMHINVRPVTQLVQGLMEGAYFCAHELAGTSIAKQLTCMSNEDREEMDPTYRSFYDAIEPEIRRIAVANEALQSSTDGLTQDSRQYFQYLITLIYIGQYAIMGTRLPGNTQWCVD